MKVLVVGGMGYIGAHVVAEIACRGYKCDVIDRNTRLQNYDFVVERCSNIWNREVQGMHDFLPTEWSYDAVVLVVGKAPAEKHSINPHLHWYDNLTAIMALNQVDAGHFILVSASAAGISCKSPYARSKLAAETYLQDLAAVPEKNFDGFTILRAFSVSGATKGISCVNRDNRLINRAIQVARGKKEVVKIYGTDYPTPDGTPLRDYIHVADVASSIVNGIEKGPTNTPYEELGTGKATSVLEVIEAVREVTGKSIDISLTDRRQCDVATLVATRPYHHISLTHDLNSICLSTYRQE